MKPQKLKILSLFALTAAVATSASTASAAGRLGQRYIEATVDYVIWDNDVALDNGLGATLTYNQPLAKALDLNIAYSYLSADFKTGPGSINGNDLRFGGTWFTPLADGKFYTRAALGWSRARSGGFSDSTTTWNLEGGYEFALGSSASITPSITYRDAFESGFASTWEFGVAGEFDLSSTTAFIIKANINDDSDIGISGGVVLRF